MFAGRSRSGSQQAIQATADLRRIQYAGEMIDYFAALNDQDSRKFANAQFRDKIRTSICVDLEKGHAIVVTARQATDDVT